MDEKNTLNFYKWVFGTCLMPNVASLLHLPSIGMAWTGYAWFLMLLVDFYYLLAKPGKVSFPYGVWMPWIVVLVGYWMWDLSYFGLQATLQYLCFLLTGFASSKLLYTDAVMEKLFRWFTYLAYYFIVGKLIGFVVPVNATGGIAALAMIYSLFGAVGLSLVFIYGKSKGWWLYLVPLFIVAVMVTRMGILMMLVVGAFHFANKKVALKLSVITLVSIMGLLIFNSDAFQEKTFGKKRGEISQIEMRNGRMANINNNGRDYMWDIMDKGIAESPVFGNGTRAELKALKKAGLIFSECHSDYRAVTYDYGFFGLTCLMIGFLLNFLHLKSKQALIEDEITMVTFYSALTLFLVWIGFMYSDNIMKYASQFGNLHFCLISITYARIAYADDINNYTTLQQRETDC